MAFDLLKTGLAVNIVYKNFVIVKFCNPHIYHLDDDVPNCRKRCGRRELNYLAISKIDLKLEFLVTK